MQNLSKTEMLMVLANCAVEMKLLEYSNNNIKTTKEYFDYFSVCDNISEEITYIKGTYKSGIVEIVEENSKDTVLGNDRWEQYIVFKITDNDGKQGYIQFDGVYDSWDSSYYDRCYAVVPKQIQKTKFQRR